MNIRGVYIFAGLFIYIATALDSSLGWISYFTWVAAFLLLATGWSVLFSILCLLSSVSFKYMSVESTEQLQSLILPWVFGVSFAVIFLILFFKHHSPGGITSDTYSIEDIDGGSGCDSDGGGGGGDA